MLKFQLITFIGIALLGSSFGLNLCGEWAQYSSFKCIKVLDVKATEEEAHRNCNQLETTSSLITIHSKDEQQFLNNLLSNYNRISMYAWIGMKFENKSYQWLDGSVTNFTNWADDAVKDGTDPCVQMALVKESLGKWTDESCKKTALAVCQKRPVLNLNILRESIDKQEKIIEKLAERIDTIIPMGFLYTQLPEQSSPQELWPHLNWTDVTQEYSGLFFRAEGNGSALFGQVQNANQSWISEINMTPISRGDGYGPSTIITPTVSKGGWVSLTTTYGVHDFALYTTAGEVRPKNTAVKIWKRTEY